jgi:hypothetical protein
MRASTCRLIMLTVAQTVATSVVEVYGLVRFGIPHGGHFVGHLDCVNVCARLLVPILTQLHSIRRPLRHRGAVA